jgi:hypothetical protein
MSVDQEPATGKGFIYILSNESMPGLLKVGLTENSIRQRIRELSSNTGVPTEFKLERAFELEVSWLFRVEKTIHRELTESGFHHQKEFFKVSLTQCTTVTEDVILRLTGDKSPDIVGLAERRLKAKEAQERWEAEELSRREYLLREANLSIAQEREKWLATQEKPSEPIATWVYPLMLGAVVIGAFSAGASHLWLEIGVLGLITAWIYQRGRNDVTEEEQRLSNEAARRYPFKSLEDIDKRDYKAEKFEEAKRSMLQEEEKLQERIKKYRTEKGV